MNALLLWLAALPALLPAPAVDAVARAPLPRPTWRQGIERLLRADALGVQRDRHDGSLVAHAPGLRLRATSLGFRLEDPGPDGAFGLRVRLVSLEGAGGRLRLEAAEPTADGPRVSWQHGQALVHRIENRPDGFEQTCLVLAEQGDAFALEFELDGLPWRLEQGGLRAFHGGREALRASPPRAFEPDGRELPARFARHGDALRIEVRGARRYPVLVDPAWTSSGQDRELARFGFAVAGVGDVNGDGFGDVLVAAPYFSTANTGAGKAYLFHGQADGLAPSWAWSSSGDDRPRAHFGLALASAGDINRDGYADFAVGAPDQDDLPRVDVGRAFVFMGSRNGASPSAAWASSGVSQEKAFFGTSLAGGADVDGDGHPDLVVGAPGQSLENGNTAQPGEVFLYRGSAQGLATSHAWTSQGDAQAGAGFGFSVSMAGDVDADGFADLVVGAYLQTQAYPAAGRAFLFRGSAAGLGAAPAWAASGDPQAYAQFGFSAAGAGDVDGDGFADVIVGAPGYDTAQNGAGRVYLYRGGVPGSGLASTYAWRYSGTDRAQARYGWAVAGAGDVNADGRADLLVGAPGDDSAGAGSGRAFLYHGSLGGPVTPPAWSHSGDDQPGAGFGSALASAGDVNADGASDLVLGAPYADSPGADAGRAYLFLGLADNPGLCQTPGEPCDDGDACTHTDQCQAGGLCRGTAYSCEDDNPCTDDTCRGDGTCGHLHNTLPCDDGDPCTHDDVCRNAICRGTTLDCSRFDSACAQGACEPTTGACRPVPLPDGSPCDDGDACTAGDTCRGGTCTFLQDVCGDEGGCGCGREPRPWGGVWLLGALGLALRRRATRSRPPRGAC
jgi:hypothetical protein